MDKAMTVALVRHGLQVGGGMLVGRGLLTAEMADLAVGALLSLATVGWYLAEQYRARAGGR